MNCRTSFTRAQTPARLSILSSTAACGSPPWMTGTRTLPAHLFRDAGSDDEFSMPLLSLKDLLSHLSSPSTAQGATGLTSSRTPASTASAHSRALSPSVAPTPRGPGPWTCSHCGEDLHLRSLRSSVPRLVSITTSTTILLISSSSSPLKTSCIPILPRDELHAGADTTATTKTSTCSGEQNLGI